MSFLILLLFFLEVEEKMDSLFVFIYWAWYFRGDLSLVDVVLAWILG